MSCSTMMSVVPSRGDRVEAGIDVADDDRRQAERQLVAQEETRIGHQRTADRRHLLLAAREQGRRRRAPLAEHREQFVDARESPGPGPAAIGAELQVLLDGQAWKEPPSFGNHGNALTNHGMRGQRADRTAIEGYHRRAARQRARDRAQEGRLARAVGADDGDRLAFIDGQIDVEECLEIAVESPQAHESPASS